MGTGADAEAWAKEELRKRFAHMCQLGLLVDTGKRRRGEVVYTMAKGVTEAEWNAAWDAFERPIKVSGA